MNDKEWTRFFNLLECVVNGEGTHSEKKSLVEQKAAENSCVGALNEFAAWFADDE